MNFNLDVCTVRCELNVRQSIRYMAHRQTDKLTDGWMFLKTD